MEDKIYTFYLKTNRTVCVIGDDFEIDYDKIFVIEDRKIKASFMVDGIEGFVTKKITESEDD